MSSNKKTFGQRLKSMGPAAIITSAFIGPGTITTCTKAGVSFGYSLLWTVVLSGIALIVLMEMSARTTLATGKNLIDSSAEIAPNSKAWRGFTLAVFVIGVLSVCFAFQAGNEIGAANGLKDILGMQNIMIPAIVVGLLALATTWLGSYKTLEMIMQFFVSAMGILFLVTAIAIKPDFGAIAKGLIPSLPDGSTVTALGLIGTTLVAINLIVHSISCEERYHSKDDLGDARFDIGINISVGVIITLAILIAAAAGMSGMEVKSPLDYTHALEPLLGSWARIIGDLALFCAGLSSAIAVSYSIRSIFSRIFKWEGGSMSMPAKIVGPIVILFGTAFAMFGKTPADIIVIAQAVSGFSLPFIAVILLAVANNKRIMGDLRNKATSNIIGVIMAALTLFLGGRTFINIIIGLFK